MKSSMKLPFAALSAVPFIMVLGNSMLIPVLPNIRSALGLSEFQGGLIITAFSIPAGLIIPFAGFLSDRFGRKTIMAPALIVYGLGGLIAGASAILFPRTYMPILAGRVVQGIGAGGTYQLAMALTGDIFQSKERTKALGLLEASNGLGKVVSPVAGAAAGLLAWFAPFFVYGFLAIPVAFAVWFLIREPQASRQKRPLKVYFSQLRSIMKDKAVTLLASYAAGAVALFILFGVLSFYSDVLEQDFGVKGFTKGFVIAGPVLAMAIMSYVSGTMLQKQIGKFLKALVVAGLLAVTAGLAVLAFVQTPAAFFSALVAVGAGTGLILPSLNTLITSSAPTEERGIVTSLYGTVRFFGVAIGPPAFGLALKLGRPSMFLGAAVLTLVTTATAFFLIDQRRMLPPEMREEALRPEEPLPTAQSKK